LRFPTISGASVAIGLAALAGAAVGGLVLAYPLTSLWGPAADTAQAPAELADFPFETADGKSISLKDFQGRAVLLNIWATWCPPCRKEMPSLDRLQSMRGGDDFEVVALSIDKAGVEKVKPFYDEIGIGLLKVYLDKPGASMQALRIVGLPTTLLIGEDGRELARWAGPREWDEPDTVAEIDALLKISRED